MTVEEMFDEYAGFMYPGLSRDSKQWRSLKHSFYAGIKAAGVIQAKALENPFNESGFDVKAMITALKQSQDEVARFFHPPAPLVEPAGNLIV